MSPQFPAHRDAEDFARVLDGGTTTAVTERYADLVRTVTLLREQPRPEPRAAFVEDLRARLMAEADTVLVADPHAPTSLDVQRARRIGRRERHLGAAAAALVLVGATTGMAAAAQGSLPGQTLYPLKRGIESVEVHLSTSDSTRGQQLLDQASTRLSEVRALVDGPSTPESAALVRSTLDDFTATADQGSRLLFTSYQSSGDASDISAVRDFTHGTMDVLSSLAGARSDGASSFASAGQTLAAIDQQARVLCRGCSDAAPLTVPSALVDLTSAAALQQLVTAPAQAVATPRRHHPVRDLAAAAQKAAAAAGTDHAGTTSTPPATAPSAPSDGSTRTALPSVPSSGGSQPLQHLISGLTTTLPGGLGGTVQGLTDGVGQTVTGVTDGLQQTTSGLSDTLGNTLGGVTGLLGGTTSGTTSGTTGTSGK